MGLDDIGRSGDDAGAESADTAHDHAHRSERTPPVAIVRGRDVTVSRLIGPVVAIARLAICT